MTYDKNTPTCQLIQRLMEIVNMATDKKIKGFDEEQRFYAITEIYIPMPTLMDMYKDENSRRKPGVNFIVINGSIQSHVFIPFDVMGMEKDEDILRYLEKYYLEYELLSVRNSIYVSDLEISQKSSKLRVDLDRFHELYNGLYELEKGNIPQTDKYIEEIENKWKPLLDIKQ